MYDFIEPANKQHFQITWESTLKCNLDCSYCSPNNHNNSIPHPGLEDCLKTVDFLLEYVDIYMEQKNPEHRNAGFNVLGGESLFHPDIVKILKYIKTQHGKYSDRWTMSVQTVTNAVVKEKIWNQIVPLVDYFTISYHSEATEEQQDLVRKNILYLKQQNKHFQVSILMHSKQWDNCQRMVAWCKENNVPYLPRQIDHSWHQLQFYYNKEQSEWWDKERGITSKPSLSKKIISLVNMSQQGRNCCGGNSFSVGSGESCTVQDYVYGNNFKGWKCSVNYFFVFVKQVTREVFVNKDCQADFNGGVGPIGTLDNTDKIIEDLKTNFQNNTMPVITCPKSKCWCGLCAPKARTEEIYNTIIEKYTTVIGESQ